MRKTRIIGVVNLLGDVEKYNENFFVKVRSSGRLIKAKIKLSQN